MSVPSSEPVPSSLSIAVPLPSVNFQYATGGFSSGSPQGLDLVVRIAVQGGFVATASMIMAD